MNQEPLTHSETYLKKTNRIILTVGIASLLIFIFGLALLLLSNDNSIEYEAPQFTSNDDALNIADKKENSLGSIEFGNITIDEIPLTTTPNPVPLGQITIGNDARNVLTLGTNNRGSVYIQKVSLADPPPDGFSFVDNCSGAILRGEETCHIQISWIPVVSGNVQNNFIILWQEVGLGSSDLKSAKVPVIGVAVSKDNCSYCDPNSGNDDERYKVAR